MKTGRFKLSLLIAIIGCVLMSASVTLEGALPLKLDVQTDVGDNAGVLQSGWQQLVDTGTFDGIAVTIEAASGDLGYRDRGQTGLVELDLWRDFIFASSGDLTVTIEGLEPDEVYEISLGSYDDNVRHGTPRIADWQVDGETVLTTVWGIPGVSLDNLRPGMIYQAEEGWPEDYYHYSNGEEIDYMVSAVLLSDSDGKIVLQSTAGDEGTYSPWLNGIMIDYGQPPAPSPPYDPEPADGSTGVSVQTELTWKGGPYWADPTKVNPDIQKYYVWMSSGDSGDNTLTHIGTVEVTDYNDISADGNFPVELETDSTYYWAVEAALDDGSGGAYAPGNSNNLVSETWSFETIPSVPYITGHPNNVMVAEQGTAELTVEYDTASNITDVEWYKDGVALDPAGSNIDVYFDNDYTTLTISDVGSDDEGVYNCVVTNAAGIVTSDDARLTLKKLLSWYQFEQNADDSEGVNDGTVYGDPGYVEGITKTSGQFYAADLNGSSYILLPYATAYPRAGFGNGLETLTYSGWVKLESGQGGHLLSNFNDGSNTGVRFSVQADGIGFYLREEGDTAVLRSVSGLTLDDNQWHHIAVTYDGANVAFYLDGIQEQISSAAALTDFADWENSMPLLALGNRGNHQELFNGQVDDLRIYNYAKSQEGIGMLYYEVTDEVPCIYGSPEYDFVDDCMVNVLDFARFAEEWLESGLYDPEN